MSKIKGPAAPTPPAPKPAPKPEPPKAPEPAPKAPAPTKKDDAPDPAPVAKSKDGAKAGSDAAPDKGDSKPKGLLSKALESIGLGSKAGGADKKPERSTADVLGKADNDGRAETLRGDNHDGRIDSEIEQLKGRKAHLENMEGNAREQLKRLTAGRGPEQGARAGAGALANDAAIAAAKQDLADVTEGIQAQNTSLQQQRALNMLADAAYVTDLSKAAPDILEGEDGPAIEVVDETATGSTAAYDSKTDTIKVTDEAIEEATELRKELHEDGLVDFDGNIVRPNAFDASTAADAAIQQAALVGVHEPAHAQQAGAGEEMLEYTAYHRQERAELRAGREKEGFLTVRADGSNLPQAQGAANVEAFTSGEEVVYGDSAGELLGEASPDGHDHDHEAPGRYAPGAEAPGRYAPGRYAPGSEAPGRYAPGDEAPGRYAPGRYAPGRYAPGSEAPGRYAPGRYAPGRYAPGDEAPGRYAPGRYAPGRYAPGELLD